MGKIYSLKRPRIYAPKKCLECGKEYRSTTSKQKYCSTKCSNLSKEKEEKTKKKDEDKKLKSFFSTNQPTSILKKYLKRRKHKIVDEKVIDYATSPTGKAYIGVAKTPLMIASKGYGYQGILLQTENREFIQCHVCGKWQRFITSQHLKSHNITADKYRQKFGLLKSRALVSDAQSLAMEENARKNLDIWRTNMSEVNRRNHAIKATKKGHAVRKKLAGTPEHDNKFGLCEKQLGFRLLEYVKAYKDLPSVSQKGEGISISKALAKRYGTLNEGFKHYELPVRYRQGTAVELLAQNKKQLFFNYNKQSYNRDAVYQWIVENSPILSEPNRFKD